MNPSLSTQPMSNIFKEMTTIHDDCVLVGDRDWAHSIPIFASQWEMNLINYRDFFNRVMEKNICSSKIIGFYDVIFMVQ